MLDPRDIESKQFTTTRLKEGYDQDEVDAFLDRLQEDYAFLTQQVAKLEADNEILRRKANDAPTAQLSPVAEPPSVVAQKLLEAADAAAKGHEADARAKADATIRDAGAQGAKIVEEAHAAAEKIKNEGLADKYKLLQEIEAKQEKAQKSYDSLVRQGASLRKALADMANTYDSEFPRA